MAYSDKVIDHYENPRNVGTFDKNDESVGTGMVGAPACGDVMRLQIKVNDEGIIEVITAPNDWAGVKAALEAAGYKSVDGDVTMRAQNETELSGEDAVKMQKLIDALEDLDDVQDVYTSAVLNLD